MNRDTWSGNRADCPLAHGNLCISLTGRWGNINPLWRSFRREVSLFTREVNRKFNGVFVWTGKGGDVC